MIKITIQTRLMRLLRVTMTLMTATQTVMIIRKSAVKIYVAVKSWLQNLKVNRKKG